MLTPLNPAFGSRLKEAFKGASVNEIADKLQVSYNGARNYLLGRVPSWDKLIEISNITSCSIEWLLTGKGSRDTSVQVNSNSDSVCVQLGTETKNVLEYLADRDAQSIQDKASELLLSAIVMFILQADPEISVGNVRHLILEMLDQFEDRKPNTQKQRRKRTL